MRHKPLVLCVLASTVLSTGLATVRVVLAQQPVGKASSGMVGFFSTTKATTGATITQEIAKLEVERALQGTRYTSDSPTIRAIDSQLRSLRQRLLQIQPDGNTGVAIAISKAIKGKIAELELERARQATRYTSDSPIIQAIDSQLRRLRQRLAQIQQ